MNLNKVRFVNEILTEQMNHWMIFPIALAMTGVELSATLRKPQVLAWILCGIIPFILFYIRNKTEQIFPFIMSHIVLIVAVALIPMEYGSYRFVNIACAVYYCFNSISLKCKKKAVYSNVIQLPVAVALCMISGLFQSDLFLGKWYYYYLIPLLISIALFYVVFYIQRYMDFLNVNKSSAGYLPARDMFHSGLGLVIGYTGICILILLLSTNINFFTDIWNVIKQAVWKFLRYLFSLLPEKSSYIEPKGEDESVGMFDNILNYSGETYWIWDLLQFVFLISLCILTIVILIKLIIKLIQYVQGRFSSNKKTEEQDEEAFDIREKCEIEKAPPRKRKNILDAFAPNERIRKLYKKRLLDSSAYMLEAEREKLGIYTAREWERKIETDGMAEIYEQARYSGREMTPADVKRMKTACKQQTE